MEEQWRDVVGYEGFYEVSDQGRIKRVEYGQGSVPGRILCTWLTGGRHHGRYPTLRLSVRGIEERFKVHTLVCQAFHGMPTGDKCEVRHKNRISTDNRADNLEWVTRKETCLYAMEKVATS